MSKLLERLQAIKDEKAKIKAEDLIKGTSLFGIEGTIKEIKGNGYLETSAREIMVRDVDKTVAYLSPTIDADTVYRKNSYMMLKKSFADLAKDIKLTPEKITSGNTILGVEGTAIEGIDPDTIHEVVEGYGIQLPNTNISAQVAMDLQNVLIDVDTAKTSDNKEVLLRAGSNCQVVVPNTTIAQTVGLTSDKIVAGNTILGVHGSASADVPFEEEAEYAEALTICNEILGLEE